MTYVEVKRWRAEFHGKIRDLCPAAVRTESCAASAQYVSKEGDKLCGVSVTLIQNRKSKNTY